MSLNVYYYNGKVQVFQKEQCSNKKKIFPLLYNVTNVIYVPFNNSYKDEINTSIYQLKNAFIGYKKVQNNQNDKQYILIVNNDDTWDCVQFQSLENKTEFVQDDVIFKGCVILNDLHENHIEKIEQTIDKMKKQSVAFLNAKILQYQRNLSCLMGE